MTKIGCSRFASGQGSADFVPIEPRRATWTNDSALHTQVAATETN